MKSSDFFVQACGKTGNGQDMKKQMTISILSAMIDVKFTLNNTRHTSPDFSSECAPRWVTFLNGVTHVTYNEKKIVTNKKSSVTVVSKMTLNNTRPASDSSAPRRVTYFGRA